MKPQRNISVQLGFITWLVLICSGRLRRAQPQSGGDMSASPNDSTEETAAVFPPTYIVIQFSKHIRTTALVWLVDKICGKRLDGGAELLVRKQPHRNGEVR
jgi:anoctamin-10